MGKPELAALPDDYFAYAREIETPVLFTTGANNNVFRDSNIECHRRLAQLGSTQHELKIFPGYGHQDVFMGKDVARDCFPAMLEFIRRHGEPARGRGVGREIGVRVGREAAHHEIADHAAHQIQLVPGEPKALAHLLGQGWNLHDGAARSRRVGHVGQDTPAHRPDSVVG